MTTGEKQFGKGKGQDEKIKNIGKLIATIEKFVKGFETPVSTQISEDSRDPYQVLVSCLLSLRTKDTVTGHVSRKLFQVADTPEKITRMPLKRLQGIVRPVNYYKTKAKRIRNISEQLVEQYGSVVPTTFDELMKFKGVGRKTANIVMVYGYFSTEHIPVDIHVHRIPNRIGWIRTKTPEETEEALKKLVPKRYWRSLNDNLVTFGQNICLPVSPKCSVCPIEQHCQKRGVMKQR